MTWLQRLRRMWHVCHYDSNRLAECCNVCGTPQGVVDGDPQYWAALIDALIAAVRAEAEAEIERLTRIAKSCGEQADTWAERYRDMKARADAAEAESQRLQDEAILSSHRHDMELTRVSEENQRLREQLAQAQP